MKFWWLTDLSRLQAERLSITALTRHDWFRQGELEVIDFKLRVPFMIVTQGKEFSLFLNYPDQFPSVPAWITPRDPDLRLSNHQYGAGGSLCLEARPDNWMPSVTGADLIESAYRLLHQEATDGAAPVPSAHTVAPMQDFISSGRSVLIHTACHDRLFSGASVSLKARRWNNSDDVDTPLIFDQEIVDAGLIPNAVVASTWSITDNVLLFDGEIGSGTVPDSVAKLAEVLGKQISEFPPVDSLSFIVLRSAGKLCIFARYSDDSIFLRRIHVINEESGRRSNATASRSTKTICVCGLGSVGSKVAESLVRSGISRLLIVDGDIFLPGNLERHTLDWRDVGGRKVNALKRRLANIAPKVVVEVITSNLNWQRSAKLYATDIDQIASCDLIINATGDAGTALQLGALANSNNKQFLSVEVFEGGIGCAIARSVPGVDPAYSDGYAAYNRYCSELDVIAPASGSGDYEAQDSDGTIIIADDASISIAAGHASRIALDLLDDLPIESPAWMLIGFKTAWIFSAHGNVHVLDVGPPLPINSRPDPSAETVAFSLELARSIAAEV